MQSSVEVSCVVMTGKQGEFIPLGKCMPQCTASKRWGDREVTGEVRDGCACDISLQVGERSPILGSLTDHRVWSLTIDLGSMTVARTPQLLLYFSYIVSKCSHQQNDEAVLYLPYFNEATESRACLVFRAKI